MSGGRGGRGGGPPGPAAGAGYYNGGGYGSPPGGYPGLNEMALILLSTSCVNVVNICSSVVLGIVSFALTVIASY